MASNPSYGPIWEITALPKVVEVPDQPCQQLYEANPVLLGYDVVQYHFIPSYKQGGVAVRGVPEFAYNFEGYQFWFSSEHNRNLFIGDPWKYAPAWGGFCSWGIALELPPVWPWKKSYLGPPASPWEGWLIVDGTLMFNIWDGYSDRFMRSANQNVKLAADRWKKWFNNGTAGPFNTHCIGHGPLKNWCLSQQPSPWMQPLPECTEEIVVEVVVTDNSTTTTNGEASSTTTTTVVKKSGGGIVSNAESFDDFTKSTLSPYQTKWIIALSVLGFVLLCLIAGVVVYCCCWRKRNRTAEKDVEVASKKSSEPQTAIHSDTQKDEEDSSSSLSDNKKQQAHDGAMEVEYSQ